MSLVGELCLWVALLMAAWSTTVSFAGGALRRNDLVNSGVRGLYATFGMVLVASIGLWYSLLTKDFSLDYVASHISSTMPNAYIFTSFWSGQAGSMLFWALILSMYGTVAISTSRKRNPELIPWATGTLAAILVFFVLTMCFKANPFERLNFIPADGKGMNPQLQNPGMAIHPPCLYLGYVATAIPFAFAIAALFSRKLDAEWLAVVRRWALVSWFFLTIGIILGMWWAYVELGWSGYWAWDPVENSSFLPWLTTTAFLHSIMIQEKRGMLRKWNVVLVVMSFLLAIFGTFITRSGVIESVHSFAQSPVGPWFGTFFVISVVTSIYLVGTRLNDLQAKAELESMVSREAAFLYNNLVLCGIAFAVLWGTVFPIISEWAKGTKVTVGAPFFNTVNVPLGLLLLLLTGVGPLIAWRRASVSNLKRQFATPALCGVVAGVAVFAAGMRSVYPIMTYALCGFVTGTILQEFYKGVRARQSIHNESIVTGLYHLVVRNRRRYGGYIIHAGIVMLFAAFAGLAFKSQYDITLKTGQSFETNDPYGHHWRFVSQGVSTSEPRDKMIVGVGLDTYRDGKRVGIIASAKDTYFDSQHNQLFQPITDVGIHSTPALDTYLVLAGVRDKDTAELTLTYNPLVMWVWIGGFVMMIGGLIVMWPQAERRRAQAGYAAVMPSALATDVPVTV
ncbi:MAG TPA: cytochrome c-type biogenesis CcmF C-terminal domain-containing protein [Gemmatimonadaceae bacterium]|jgi:cytochrome c-type biogenesis protein CcmF